MRVPKPPGAYGQAVAKRIPDVARSRRVTPADRADAPAVTHAFRNEAAIAALSNYVIMLLKAIDDAGFDMRALDIHEHQTIGCIAFLRDECQRFLSLAAEVRTLRDGSEL
jgi:hypothetical protein